MNQTAFESQFRAFLDVMTTPEGVIGLLVLMGLIIAVVISKRFKWVILALLMWTTTLAFVVVPGESRPTSLLPPFDQIRAQSRPICVALLLVLTVATFISSKGWRRHWLGIGAITFFFFQLVLAFRIMVDGETSRGIASFVIYPLMFIPLGIGLSRWLQEWKDVHALLRCFVAVGLLFLGGSIIHLLFAASTVVRNKRLYGTCGNPQLAAATIAACLPVICYFIIRGGQRLIWRFALCAVAGFLIIMLLWTGSRTGMLTALVGLAVLFRARIGRFALAGVVVGIFVLLALQIYTESTATFSDMFLRGDTRSHVWTALLEQFRDHMAWGVMTDEIGVKENSYLWVAAATGLFGVIPMLIFLLASGWQLFRLQRLRKFLGDNALLADLAASGLISLATACMFEGYIAGTMTLEVINCFIGMALTTFLIDAAENLRARQMWARQLEDENAPPVDEYADELAYAAAAAHPHSGQSFENYN